MTLGLAGKAVQVTGAGIVNTASVWARSAIAEFAASIASKHAVLGVTHTFARELRPRGITVNACWVRTDAARRMAERSGRDKSDIFAEVSAAQALPGLAQPADVAGIPLFLASGLAANITGQADGADRGEFPG